MLVGINTVKTEVALCSMVAIHLIILLKMEFISREYIDFTVPKPSTVALPLVNIITMPMKIYFHHSNLLVWSKIYSRVPTSLQLSPPWQCIHSYLHTPQSLKQSSKPVCHSGLWCWTITICGWLITTWGFILRAPNSEEEKEQDILKLKK